MSLQKLWVLVSRRKPDEISQISIATCFSASGWVGSERFWASMLVQEPGRGLLVWVWPWRRAPPPPPPRLCCGTDRMRDVILSSDPVHGPADSIWFWSLQAGPGTWQVPAVRRPAAPCWPSAAAGSAAAAEIWGFSQRPEETRTEPSHRRSGRITDPDLWSDRTALPWRWPWGWTRLSSGLPPGSSLCFSPSAAAPAATQRPTLSDGIPPNPRPGRTWRDGGWRDGSLHDTGSGPVVTIGL